MSVIEIRLRHRFGGLSIDAQFDAPVDGVTALFGPSGAGKTTIINTVAGLFAPQEGYVRVADHVLLDTSNGLCVAPHKRRIGYVFQDARLFPHLDVHANCMFGARRAADTPAQTQIDSVIALLDLKPLLERYPINLSGGERQRVAIARALLSSPQLLLLDEPLASLDQARKSEVLPYLKRLRSTAHIPIIFVSHALDEVAALARHIVVLDRGRVRAQGAVSDVMARPDLFPVHGPIEAGAVIDATVVAHHDEDRLSEVTVGSQSLWLPQIDVEPTRSVRLRIRARDVIVALERPRDISANNILAGKVAGIGPVEGAWVELQIDCGSGRLLASITQRSMRRLALAAGSDVYAIIKSVNLG